MAGKDVIAVVMGKPVTVKEKDQLSSLVFGALLDQYAKDHKIEPMEAEIDVFLRKQEEMSERSRIESGKEKARLIEELKSPALTEEQREKKKSELEMTESILKTQQETAEGAKAMEVQLRPIMRKMAAQQVRMWKINQSLFRKYGGRVIFQQAGVEPLDAYRDFLKAEEKKGTFRIIDKVAEASFWKYFTDDTMHTFYKKDDGPKLMEKPFWLMDKPLGE